MAACEQKARARRYARQERIASPPWVTKFQTRDEALVDLIADCENVTENWTAPVHRARLMYADVTFEEVASFAW